MTSIPIWSGRIPGEISPISHYWYTTRGGDYLRVCDNTPWPNGTSQASEEIALVPCKACDALYVADLATGLQLLDPSSTTAPAAVYSPVIGEDTRIAGGVSSFAVVAPQAKDGLVMEIQPVPMATFARFYEATGPKKVTMVREARMYQSDPDSYKKRDFYRDLHNTLRQTHWETDDVSVFKDAIDSMVACQKEFARSHYREVADKYVAYWQRMKARFFEVPGTHIELADLPIIVAVEVGMSYPGNNLALKLWLNAPRPTRGFRQAVKYITDQGRQRAKWDQDWQAAIWDVRREDVLPDVAMPREIRRAIEGQASAFREIWRRLEA